VVRKSLASEELLLHKMLVTKVDDCLNLTNQCYQTVFQYQSIQINIRGKTAGQVRYYLPRNTVSISSSTSKPILRFNPVLLNRYGQAFIDEVVPHECAHLVGYQLYGMRGKAGNRVRPHGAEWQQVMRDLYRLEPKVTHKFEVERSKRNHFLYRCHCPELVHRLSVIRHNRVMKQQAIYKCKHCSESIEFKGEKEYR